MLIKFYLEYAFNVRIGVKRVRERFLFYLKKKKKKRRSIFINKFFECNVTKIQNYWLINFKLKRNRIGKHNFIHTH